MNRLTRVALSIWTIALLGGCDNAPGRPAIDAEHVAPDRILDFKVLYRTNCAACHGSDGRGGAAVALADSMYLRVADDVVIRRATADGIAGTPMPAFAIRSGGMLTDEQVDAIVHGIRTEWTNPDAITAIELPAYSDPSTGSAQRGEVVFATYCASCHGNAGHGGGGGSSIVDESYLALVSDQGLRTMVIVGRPELGAPDWRGNVPGTAMTFQEITDVVAWLSALRRERGAP